MKLSLPPETKLMHLSHPFSFILLIHFHILVIPMDCRKLFQFRSFGFFSWMFFSDVFFSRFLHSFALVSLPLGLLLLPLHKTCRCVFLCSSNWSAFVGPQSSLLLSLILLQAVSSEEYNNNNNRTDIFFSLFFSFFLGGVFWVLVNTTTLLQILGNGKEVVGS